LPKPLKLKQMKKQIKNSNKKLVFIKETVAILDRKQQTKILGGNNGGGIIVGGNQQSSHHGN